MAKGVRLCILFSAFLVCAILVLNKSLERVTPPGRAKRPRRTVTAAACAGRGDEAGRRPPFAAATMPRRHEAVVRAGRQEWKDRPARAAAVTESASPASIPSAGITLSDGGEVEIRSAAGAPLAAIGLSPAGDKLLVGMENGNGLYVHDLAGGAETLISGMAGAGYGASWSPLGDRVAYKEVDTASGKETPVIYDTRIGRSIPMDKEGDSCGVPVLAPDGRIGFTAGNDLYVYGENLSLHARMNLGQRGRQMAFSPDGTTVAVTTGEGVSIADLNGGVRDIHAPAGRDYREPRYSPDGGMLSIESTGGGVCIVDIASGEFRALGRGRDAQWFPDGSGVVFLRNRSHLIDGVDSSEIVVSGPGGGEAHSIARGDGETFSWLSLSRDGTRLVAALAAGGRVALFTLAPGHSGAAGEGAGRKEMRR